MKTCKACVVIVCVVPEGGGRVKMAAHRLDNTLGHLGCMMHLFTHSTKTIAATWMLHKQQQCVKQQACVLVTHLLQNTWHVGHQDLEGVGLVRTTNSGTCNTRQWPHMLCTVHRTTVHPHKKTRCSGQRPSHTPVHTHQRHYHHMHAQWPHTSSHGVHTFSHSPTFALPIAAPAAPSLQRPQTQATNTNIYIYPTFPHSHPCRSHTR